MLARMEFAARAVWPTLVALTVIIVTRHALVGLVSGALAGALLLTGGNPVTALVDLSAAHLIPSLASSWKLGAIAFTLILGGFAAVLEAGGGFTALLTRFAGKSEDAGRRLETAAAALGILCFFDGLANSMVVGRVSRDLADRSGVARVKLAYITDSTSSAVACVALISTWIAFQLTMIGEAFELAGRDANPYLVFLESLPHNYYCWFTLVLLFVSVRGSCHFGPMAEFVREARLADPPPEPVAEAGRPTGSLASVLTPLAVLIATFFLGFLLLGGPRPLFPLSRDKIVAAFGSDAGPQVLVLAAVVATLVAVAMFPRRGRGGWAGAGRGFLRGVGTMVGPIFILLAAWMLGSVLGALGTADLIAGLVTGGSDLAWLPTLVFLTGAAVSFSTGTSWGTMGLLFPLAVPAAATMGADDSFLHLIVAAVFSGAVFGDHCSPFSDTTIVTSISCGVEPHDHVRTQIPYALVTAGVAVGLGFLPAGYGLPGWVSLLVGSGFLLMLPRFAKWGRFDPPLSNLGRKS